MFHKTNNVFDCELKIYDDHYNFDILNNTDMPRKDTAMYMQKLQGISNRLNRWMVAHLVRDALEGLTHETLEEAFEKDGKFTVALGVSAMRMDEFE